jgi:hypothetical protein
VTKYFIYVVVTKDMKLLSHAFDNRVKAEQWAWDKQDAKVFELEVEE